MSLGRNRFVCIIAVFLRILKNIRTWLLYVCVCVCVCEIYINISCKSLHNIVSNLDTAVFTKLPPPLLILIHMNLHHAISTDFFKIPFSIILPSTPRSFRLFFPWRFSTETLCSPFLYSIRATCPAFLIFLGLISRTVFGEEYRAWSSSLCNLF
jgi:hypothetical protein